MPFGRTVIESQKLPRDSGESIFAARHQDVSQGPLGKGSYSARGRSKHLLETAFSEPLLRTLLRTLLGGRFGYFLFFLLGEEEGGVRGRWEGGCRFFIENPRRRGGFSRRGRGRGAGSVLACGELGIFGGGLNIFFRGRNVHQAFLYCRKPKKAPFSEPF